MSTVKIQDGMGISVAITLGMYASIYMDTGANASTRRFERSEIRHFIILETVSFLAHFASFDLFYDIFFINFPLFLAILCYFDHNIYQT